MARWKLYPHGLTAGIPGKPPKKRGARSVVRGWSLSSIRSFVRFLYSLSITRTTERVVGSSCLSYTLTLADCPPSPDHWKRLRESFFRSLRRHDVVCIIWLTEWQRRGVPHLHGIVILPAGFDWVQFLRLWLKVAKDYGAKPEGQNAKPIYDRMGWYEYLGKHSARGLHHYQRDGANIPKQWQGETGRMWGKRGDWFTHEPLEIDSSERSYFQFRRILRSKAVAETRANPKKRRYIGKAKRALKWHDPFICSRRGISVFLEHDQSLAILNLLRVTE